MMFGEPFHLHILSNGQEVVCRDGSCEGVNVEEQFYTLNEATFKQEEHQRIYRASELL